MIINRADLIEASPIRGMLTTKERLHGVSHGLAEAGYDIRIKQEVTFFPGRRFILASSLERFEMPPNLVGVVHDKSTWVRRGIAVFNTVIEPGWEGFLTLEIRYHKWWPITIPAGAGIAQVLFHETKARVYYQGKYQNQADKPVKAIAA